MKTLKIKNNTHKILKWIQAQDIIYGMPKNETDIDSIIFKSLCHYANQRRFNIEPLKEILENNDEK